MPSGWRPSRRAGAGSRTRSRPSRRMPSCASSCSSCCACSGSGSARSTSSTVASGLDAAALAMAQTYGEAVRCEALRREVFAGRKSPLVFGEPEQWLALLIESLLVAGQGEAERAERLRLAPSTRRRRRPARSTTSRSSGSPMPTRASGRCSRRSSTGATTGCRSRGCGRVTVEEPADLRDVVWMPAHLQFENGGDSVALIPTRYPGSEAVRRRSPSAGPQDDLGGSGGRSPPRARPARAGHRCGGRAADGRARR